MKYNLGFLDISVRYIAMLLVGIIGGLLNSIPVMILAILIFPTAILGMCPLYNILGINTRSKAES